MAATGVDNLSVFFLAQGEQSADAVMARLTAFIRAAKQTLDLAVYDMRFSDPLRTQLAAALLERHQRFGDRRECRAILGDRRRGQTETIYGCRAAA